MTFRIGEKIVCVDDKWEDPLWKYIPNRPVKGGVYTVRGYAEAISNAQQSRIFLEEIINPPWRWVGLKTKLFEEGSFPTFRFRPFIERKTDISIFVDILNRVNKRERIRA